MNLSRNSVKQLFLECLDLAPLDREAYLDRADLDEDARTEVRELLQHHEQCDSFLQNPFDPTRSKSDIARQAPTNSTGIAHDNSGDIAEAAPIAGRKLGQFTLQHRIGVGGMGCVYLAQQQSPSRKVAIKILHPHLSLDAVARRRFEYESRILANLEHAGIAKIFAAGANDLGQGPQQWFAMEFIDGQPLNRFLAEHTIPTQAKLSLMLEICDAVQYAHNRGVVHRDIKPSNILVSSPGEEISTDRRAAVRQIKIVDFGVAGQLDQSQWRSQWTQMGEIIGTLDYMSPEQVSGNANRLDQRTDVYSLGVLAFEMLSGEKPFQLPTTSLWAALKTIQSNRPRRLEQVLPGVPRDLACVVNKAMSPAVESRYDSAAEFAADIRCFIQRKPVSARNPVWTYAAGKFFARHWLATSCAMLLFLVLACGLFAYAQQAFLAKAAAVQAQAERDRFQYEAEKANAINNFMTNDFMPRLLAAETNGQVTPGAAPREQRIALVRHAADHISEMYCTRPAIEAAVRNEVGTVFYNFGAFDEAAGQYQIALELWRDSLGSQHPDTLKAVNNLGQAQVGLGRLPLAESNYRRALAGRRQALGDQDPMTLATLNNLAELVRRKGETSEARELFQELVKVGLGGTIERDKAVLTGMANYGALLADSGELSDACEIHRTVFENSNDLFGPDHMMALQSGFRLANTLYTAKSWSEAEQTLTPLIEPSRRAFGRTHGFCISLQRLLARVYVRLNRPTQARKVLQQLEHELDRVPESSVSAEQLRKIRRDLARLGS